MSTTSKDIIASHKAAAARASGWLRANHALTLKPTEALELVAQVLGAPNWQTLHGQAKQGRGPRVSAVLPATAPSSAALTNAFEACFATGHAPTDKRNFVQRDGRYIEERIQALFEGFTRGRSLGTQTTPETPAAVESPARKPDTPTIAKKHGFKAGDAIDVENGIPQILYRGTVLDVDGDKVRVSLPAADRRPFVFDLSQDHITFNESAIFTGW